MNRESSNFERRLAQRLHDPEFQAEYARATRDMDRTIAVLRWLDASRNAIGTSKSELAWKIGKRPE